MRWDWREFSALLALTWADPLALTGGRRLSFSALFDRLWWHREEVVVPSLVEARDVESAGGGGGDAGDEAPGIGPPCKHLLEAGAQMNQEAMTEVGAGVGLLS